MTASGTRYYFSQSRAMNCRIGTNLNTETTFDEEPDLRARDIIVNKLLDDDDVPPMFIEQIVCEQEGPDI